MSRRKKVGIEVAFLGPEPPKHIARLIDRVVCRVVNLLDQLQVQQLVMGAVAVAELCRALITVSRRFSQWILAFFQCRSASRNGLPDFPDEFGDFPNGVPSF